MHDAIVSLGEVSTEMQHCKILSRIEALEPTSVYDYECRNLRNGYIASLLLPGLCYAIEATLESGGNLRVTLRRRLRNLLKEGGFDVEHLETLVQQTIVKSEINKRLRSAVDALHSDVFEFLSPPTQQRLLERWVDRGTSGAMARWFKATKIVEALLDLDVALSYWRATRDWRAAKCLAYQASPDVVSVVLPELISSSEGWIVSRAAMRATFISDETWAQIRNEHPASYLYLCAKLQRTVSEVDAIEIVNSCEEDFSGGGRGLAIWSVGRMQMVSVLDQLSEVSIGYDATVSAGDMRPLE